MNKVYIQNLGMIITNRCNLDCGHCMRGCKNNKDMSKEVVKQSLNQIKAIGNLAICGGEPTLAIDVLNDIFTYIVENKIIVKQVSMVINGTNYSSEFIRLLDYINEYVSYFSHFKKEKSTYFTISYDEYHKQELKRLDMVKQYLENVKKYSESKYFSNFNILSDKLKLFREVNAESLDKSLTIDYKPMNILVTYPGKNKMLDKNGLCNIGPLMTVNVDGIITECDVSIKNQEIIYNYGNVFDNSFEEVALSKGKILKPRKWYKECAKEIQKFKTYNN